ncbi:MAG: hypothetical protein GY812_07015 [Actinomycetia bacterium]|nr:hypothetical protein [Actinomycetes bacterium]
MSDSSDRPAMGVSPEPTAEEAAAITAAVTVAMSGGAAESEEPRVPRWRFSGRWWSAPVASRRARP